MKNGRKIAILLFALLAAALSLYLLRKALAVILPLLICAGILSYFFMPIVRELEKRTHRTLAILLSFFIVFSVLLAFLRILIPLLFAQAMDIITLLPSYLEKAMDYLNIVKDHLKSLPLPGDMDVVIMNYGNKIAQMADGFLSGLAENISAVFSFLAFLLFLPVLTFYMLRDRRKIADACYYLVPQKWRPEVQKAMRNINRELRHFIVGQFTVALIHAVMSSAGSAVIGLKNALLLGFIMGMCNMIPYVGPIIGAVPILIAGLSMGVNTFIYALIMVLVVEQIDNLFISPRIIGNNIKTHPVIVMLCVLGGSAMFGLAGMLLALPAFIILRIICRSVYTAVIDYRTKVQTNYTKN